MENIEVYTEDEIIYTVIGESIENQCIRMYNERFEKDRIGKITNNAEYTKYFFLTINPNSHIELLELIKVINKIISKKWITNYLYVYEQRGSTLEEVGKGFHCHMIIERPNKPYSHIIRELGNSANRVCDVSNYHFFNIKSITEEECLRKIEYITGTKADVEKHQKQSMDIVFRRMNKLKSFYNVGIIINNATQTSV